LTWLNAFALPRRSARHIGAAGGTTFEKVLGKLRHQPALRYLRWKKVSVNETAYLAGFSEPAAFSRAFKRWTGVNPREMRHDG
jgi:AraC-like DNA-binding protein